MGGEGGRKRGCLRKNAVSKKEKGAEKVSRHEKIRRENREDLRLRLIKQLVVLPSF